jgi:hypothetical protein
VHYGQVAVGDRTMLDSLNTAAITLEAAVELNRDADMGVLAAVDAAAEGGAKKTISLKASIGKATDYIKDLPLLLSDPGVHAVGI